MRVSTLFLVLIISVLLSVVVARLHRPLPHFTTRYNTIVQQINSNPTSTWTAGHNSRFFGAEDHEIKALMGVRMDGKGMKLPRRVIDSTNVQLPASFDARDMWPMCASIGEIRDQSACGSCWAHGAVEAATDRICIETNATSIFHLSANDLNSCCDSCGFGCGGGYPSNAWDWFTTTGCVTGGNYNDLSWCESYALPSCDHHEPGKEQMCPSTEYQTPACVTTCDSKSNYTVSFQNDKRKLATAYSVGASVTDIMTEIYTRGPVEAAFTVYNDFLTYKSGVYTHQTGGVDGGHAVKILGWGNENGTDYWLVANSWNPDWGMNGFFKIKKGTDECGIEDGIVAGMYKKTAGDVFVSP